MIKCSVLLGKFMLALNAGKGDMQMSGKIVVPVTENAELRSSDLVLLSVKNYEQGLIMPLEILNEYVAA